MPSIFLQIPSYRDYELPETIKDAISKASGNNKIVFGVHNCILSSDDISISNLTIPEFAEIRYIESIAPNNIGLQMSRYLANSLYINEDFYFQIDSHMKFQERWDELAIDDYRYYESLGIDSPLITMYPPAYLYKESGEVSLDSVPRSRKSTKISFKENPLSFELTYIPSQLAVTIEDECLYTPSVSGGMIFTNGSFSKIIPNKKVAFWGEEILIAARAFTNGFNLVTARNHLVWHLYHSGQPIELAKRHHLWSDWPELWAELDMLSKQEIISIFKNEIVGESALGTVRTLEEYGSFSGLDFKNRKVILSRHEV